MSDRFDTPACWDNHDQLRELLILLSMKGTEIEYVEPGPKNSAHSVDFRTVRTTIVTIETIYTLTAPLSCGQVCNDFQWLL